MGKDLLYWASTFLDISQKSLEFLKKRYAKYKNFKCINANMDQTPFENESFDLIVTAGSLSYANNKYLMKEILRLLKKNDKPIRKLQQ